MNSIFKCFSKNSILRGNFINVPKRALTDTYKDKEIAEEKIYFDKQESIIKYIFYF